jgi:predicted RNase H-like HicB family nuclease
MEKIKVNVSFVGTNFCAGVDGIGGVVVATDKTLEGVKKEFKETFDFHIKGCIEDGDDIPDYIKNGDFELDFEIS